MCIPTYDIPAFELVKGESTGDDVAEHSPEAYADRCEYRDVGSVPGAETRNLVLGTGLDVQGIWISPSVGVGPYVERLLQATQLLLMLLMMVLLLLCHLLLLSPLSHSSFLLLIWWIMQASSEKTLKLDNRISTQRTLGCREATHTLTCIRLSS